MSFSWRVPRWLPDGLRNSPVLQKGRVGPREFPTAEFWALVDALPLEERADGEEESAGAGKGGAKP